ncbi:MAG: transcriptional regulator [Candidatus Delongbacteria bacterium]|nr:transcriptional regulator [Candidatus Delongbacteria bacterium]MBN2835551.1 transcriptional regulator [Candidatus Delongbacteria bacterium]
MSVSKEEVLNTMKKIGKAVRPGEIADELKVDSKELTKLFKVLKDEGSIISPKRCFYSLPDSE